MIPSGFKVYSGPRVESPDAVGFVLVGTNQETGERAWIRWDNENDPNNFGFSLVMDFAPDAIANLLTANEEAVKESMGKKLGTWNRLGSVPDAIATTSGLDEAIKQHDRKWIHKWFRDTDNQKFRTSSKI
jgi:hypothetical protein